MKIRFSFLMLAVCFALCACGGQTHDASEEAYPTPEEVSENASGPETVLPEDGNKELYRQVEALLKKDSEVTDIFVRGALSGGNLTAEPVRATGKYASFSSLEALLDGTYAYAGVKEYYLTYPKVYGSSVFADADGNTVYDYRYTDEKKIDISAFTTDGISVTVGDITVPLVSTSDGLRLGDSLYIKAGESRYSPELTGTADIGSAKKPCGSIFVLTVYFSTGGKPFPDGAEEMFRPSLDAALSGIRGYASEYGTDVEFEVQETYFVHRNSLDVLTCSPFALENVFASSSLGSLDGLVKAEMGEKSHDGYMVLIVSGDGGECSAKPYKVGESDKFMCERATVPANAEPELLMAGILTLFGFEADVPDEVNLYRLGFTNSIAGQYCGYLTENNLQGE